MKIMRFLFGLVIGFIADYDITKKDEEKKNYGADSIM